MKKKLLRGAFFIFALLLARFLWVLLKPVTVRVQYTEPLSKSDIQFYMAHGVPTNLAENMRSSLYNPYGGTNTPVAKSELFSIRLSLAMWGLSPEEIMIRESKDEVSIRLTDGNFVDARHYQDQGWSIRPGSKGCPIDAAKSDRGGVFFRVFRWVYY